MRQLVQDHAIKLNGYRFYFSIGLGLMTNKLIFEYQLNGISSVGIGLSL